MNTREVRLPIALAVLLFSSSLSPAAAESPAAAPAAYRVISYMKQFNQPFGLAEMSPGLFYTAVGSPSPLVFTITSQGVKTSITSFPSGHYIDGLMVSGANGRVYNSLAPDYAVFSVGAAPGKQVYPTQASSPLSPKICRAEPFSVRADQAAMRST